MESTYAILEKGLDQSAVLAGVLDVEMRIDKEVRGASLIVAQTLQGYHIDLSSVGRTFIKQSTVTLISGPTKSQRTIFLFNDVLLLCKSGANNRFKLTQEPCYLTELTVEDLADGLGKAWNANFTTNNYPVKNAIAVSSVSNTLTFSFKTLQDKNSWLSELLRLIEECNPNHGRAYSSDLTLRSAVFGCSLSELLQRENNSSGIPYVLQDIVNCLVNTALHEKDLFTAPASQRKVKLLHMLIDKGFHCPYFHRCFC